MAVGEVDVDEVPLNRLQLGKREEGKLAVALPEQELFIIQTNDVAHFE